MEHTTQMSAAHIDLRFALPRAVERYRSVRDATVRLTATLTPEDQVVQVSPETSPTKWHLAHTTWFFERFCLREHAPRYESPDDRYDYLFNSYYYGAGEMHPRAARGLLSRPTVAEVRDYRAHVDDAMEALLRERCDEPRIAFIAALGLEHEQQHQELLLTDVKQVLFVNPLGPAYDAALPAPPARSAPPMKLLRRPADTASIGATGSGFCFDNELPRHRVLLGAHALGSRLVTNGEYRAFIRAGGYRTPGLWLADGWAKVRELGWDRPLCWSEDLAREFTLGGWREIDDAAPVCHVSYYEADAFARYADGRLPTEAEWEVAAAAAPVDGNLRERGWLQPAAVADASSSPAQLFGDVWEWCASPYAPYPGFRPFAGSLGEYNGKFMCNQLVVRGGSCVTPAAHIRSSYRSFFYPHDRWQFLGFRLAKDL